MNTKKTWLAWVVLAAGMVVTAIACCYVVSTSRAAAEREFSFAFREIHEKIDNRLADQANLLRSSASLFDASGTVTRATWHSFCRRMNFEDNYSGLQALGFSELIPKAELSRHTRRTRAEGFPNYRVWPSGDRDLYSSVLYLEPFTDPNFRAFGFDMLSEPVRRSAMETARDQNAATLSGKVILKRDAGDTNQAATVMLYPVYRHGMPTGTITQRRASLLGWVFSPCRVSDLMKGTLGGWDLLRDKRIRLQVFDGDHLTDRFLLYDSQAGEPAGKTDCAEHTRLARVDFPGSHWTLRFSQPKGLLLSADSGSLWLTMAGGSTISILLFAQILSLLTTRARARQIACDLTAELQDREMFTRDILNSMAASIAVLGPDNTIIEVNEPWRRFARENASSPGEPDHIGMPYFAATSLDTGSEDEPLARQAVAGIQAVQAGNTPEFCLEYPCHSRDERRWFLMRVTPLTGVRKGVVVAHTVITPRILAQESRRQSEERFRTFVEHASDLIFSLNSLGVFTYVSPNWTEIFGQAAADPVGQPFESFVHTEDRPALKGYLASIGQNGKGGPGLEFRVRHQDGSWHYLCSNVSLVTGTTSQQHSYVGIARDYSQRKRYEKELAAARDAAEAANRAKSEFLANMSHEIRTPMNGIMGMTQLLEFTDPTAEQQEYLHDIKASSDSLLSLINDILDLSKIEAGKMDLERMEFSLRASIAEVLKTQMLLIQSKGLTLETEIAAEVPDRLQGDQLRLKQILLNIIGNAIKFTPKGTIRLSAGVTEVNGDIALLEIVVRDTGIGIASEALKGIFAPFSQADASTTRTYGGTGLGLSICTRLTELMGGRIWAESTEGVGSAFHVLIPFVVIEPVRLTGSTFGPDRSAGAGDHAAPPLRILVAEDQETNLKFSVQILQRRGHTVVAARNGQEALEQSSKGAFDFILMDIQMPVMNGIEATQAIRRAEQGTGRHVPIIALTALALHGDRERILDQGFDGYVAKPIDIDSLFGEMRRCLAQD